MHTHVALAPALAQTAFTRDVHALVTVIAPGNSYIAITSYSELLQAFSNLEVLAICYYELVLARNSELVIAICYYLELLPGSNSELVIAICYLRQKVVLALLILY